MVHLLCGKWSNLNVDGDNIITPLFDYIYAKLLTQ